MNIPGLSSGFLADGLVGGIGGGHEEYARLQSPRGYTKKMKIRKDLNNSAEIDYQLAEIRNYDKIILGKNSNDDGHCANSKKEILLKITENGALSGW
jgi:hypothetical protein